MKFVIFIAIAALGTSVAGAAGHHKNGHGKGVKDTQVHLGRGSHGTGSSATSSNISTPEASSIKPQEQSH